MLADLHVHTQCSDGTLTPQEVAHAAHRAGIGLLAVCDHNTVEGCAALSRAAASLGLRSFSGVEIDCRCEGVGNLHVLGFGIDVRNPQLLALLRGCREILDAMSDDLIAAMQADGQPVSVEEYAAFVRNPAHGGWKGIDYLGTKGFPCAYPDCMALYRQYGIALRTPWPTLREVTRCIRGAGGKAVLAHPGDRLPKDSVAFSAALETILADGIDGVECYYPSHSAEITQLCLAFCKENHLCVTCGSDSHGAFARVIDGVLYAFGEACREESELVLAGIEG